ncbi:hypothetical protein TK43_02305 [Roseovarius sp. JS7-11]|nr:hypothetical protein TK43_02305 [Roseovarius sp. JS7-11]
MVRVLCASRLSLFLPCQPVKPTPDKCSNFARMVKTEPKVILKALARGEIPDTVTGMNAPARQRRGDVQPVRSVW